MLALLSSLFRRPRADEPPLIGIADLQRRLAAGDAVTLVDVREPEEFTTHPGHLPGALNVPLGTVARRAAEFVERGQPVVVVCKTDRRSAQAAAELRAAGLQDIAVLRGGTDAWHRMGLPLER